MPTPLAHLSISVTDLDASARFYVERLDGRIGRRAPDWLDVWALGMQLTLVARPVSEAAGLSSLHFGMTTAWSDWPRWRARLGELAHVVRADAQAAKLIVRDPDGYRIEIKAYRDPAMDLDPPAHT